MAIGDKKSAVMQSDIINDFTTGGSTNVLSAEMGKTLAQRPNPNLLDNWYFGNPVNQRGEYLVKPGTPYYKEMWTQSGTTSSYIKAKSIDWGGNFGVIEINGVEYFITEVNTTCVRGYTGAEYGIDRWYVGTDGGVCLVEDGYIRTVKSGSWLNFEQTVDNFADLKGKTVTASALVDGNIALIIGIGSDQYPFAASHSGSKSIVSTTFVVPDYSETLRVILQSKNNNGANIYAAKLELGTTQTLAHQDENGNWVLNEIPN